jgi:FAD/FMN-containing dehydrogenase
MTVVESHTELRGLRARTTGKLLRQGDPGWDAARGAFNLLVDQSPALIALPEDERDVIAVVDFARRNGYRVAAQRTGHNAEPLGPLDETILLRTDRLQGVQIDPVQRIARVRSGAKWENVIPEASALGLAAPHGSTGDVSVAGYTLGGGIGWYARKRGLAANNLRAIELVTADGRLRRVDCDHEPELFWALRGGGGNFGIVTSLEVELQPVAEVYAGVLFFPIERSSEVLHAWREWVDTVPEELTSVGRILQFPPFPEVPEPLRGRSFVIVEAVFTGSEAEGRALLRPLAELGPEMNTFAMVPPAGIAELHMDPPNPTPYAGSHQLLADLDGASIDRLVAVAGPGAGSPLVSFEFRHLGGAMARDEAGHGVLASIPEQFITFGIGIVFDEASGAAVHAGLERVHTALAAQDTGRRYLNFAESKVDPACFYSPGAWDRLRAVKAAVDPDGMFQANHSIAAG